MTNYSSDEDGTETVAPTKHASIPVKKATGGAAFAEVVRAARMKAKDEEEEQGAGTAAKTV
jgi:hypothetical protein